MTRTAKIYDLVSTTGKTASDMTNSLKSIGNGSMQEGVKTMADFFFGTGFFAGRKKGEYIGWVKGSLTTVVMGGVFFGVVYAKNLYDEYKFRKTLQENGDKILKTIEDNLTNEEPASE